MPQEIKRKPYKGEPFENLMQFSNWVSQQYPVYYNHKFMAAGFVMSMPFRTILYAVNAHRLAPCVYLDPNDPRVKGESK